MWFTSYHGVNADKINSTGAGNLSLSLIESCFVLAPLVDSLLDLLELIRGKQLG